MTEKATLYTYSVIYIAAEDFKTEVPFVVAVVENESGKFMTRIEGYTEETKIAIGMEVAFKHLDHNGNAIYQFN